MRKDFLSTQHSVLFSLFVFLLPYQRLIDCEECVCVCVQYDTVQTVYELPLLPNNTAVKHFYTI